METGKHIIAMIEKAVKSVVPNATVILYGSFARGDSRPDSDIDILVLIDKAKITRDDEKSVKYPLYEIEFETGRIISPLVLSKSDWESRHRITPFYENVISEGVVL